MRRIVRYLPTGLKLLLLVPCFAWADAAAAGETPWTAIGPFGQNASVQALAVDPSSPSTIYAGVGDSSADRGGVFKSVDGGQSWTRKTTPLTFVQTVIVDPNTPSTVYAGGRSLFKSDNGGATWRSIGTGLPSSVLSLAVDPLSNSTAYATSGGGVFKSLDGGESWVDISHGLQPFGPGDIAIDPASPSTLYLAADAFPGGLFKSTNGGDSWTQLTNGLGTGGAQKVFVSPTPVPTVFASTSNGVFRSLDGGASWMPAGTGLQSPVSAFAADSLAVYAGGLYGGVFKTTDGGVSWSSLGLSSPVFSVALDPHSASTIYAGTGMTGFFRSLDGGATWTASNLGLTGAYVTVLGVDPTAPSTLYAGVGREYDSTVRGWTGGVLKSIDRGATWIAANPSDSGEGVSALAFDPSAPGIVYVAISRDGVFKTTDGGVSWSHADAGLGVGPFYGSQYFTALAVDPVTPTTLYAGLSTLGYGFIPNGYVFKSIDAGESWAQLPVTLSFGWVFGLAVDPQSSAIYAPGARSTDGGATWQLLQHPCNQAYDGSMTVASDSAVYMACGSVYKSTDGAASWVAFEGAGSRVVVDPTNPLVVYAGGPGGVLRTLDGGATWSVSNDGLTDPNVTALAIDPVNSANVYAGTGSTGVFTKTFAGPAQPLCAPTPTTLCLVGGRFKAQVSWSVPADGRSGAGIAAQLTSDTGDFWFFNRDNVELVLKVLDGRALNHSFWVFYGALSNVQYTIRVTDTETGAVKTYENPSGTLASEADTKAFPESGSAPAGVEANGIERRSASELYGMYAALSNSKMVRKVEAAPCSPGGTTLCLNQSRFQVTVAWEVPSQGRSGSGSAVHVTDDTGYFWFFNDANVELMVKVLDGEQINGHYWVFYGALSNVAYTVTVTDTATGEVRTYTNADGILASVADTRAF